jgi:hypothetical protein
MDTMRFFPGEKQQDREADHSPPSSNKIKNGGDVPHTPHMSSLRDASLIKHRVIFPY